VTPAFEQKLKEAEPELGEELAKRLQGALPAIALTGHPALSTAFLNDVDGSMGFAQQVYGYGRKGDVFLGITTSGNSKNILYAAAVAKAAGLKVIGLTGRDGGRLKAMADACIVVPEQETFKIQEFHLPVYHALCLMLEEYFYEV
jgi:D-sedoheptulose 7-phosphate isomerase